ncbi:MAG: hypothetical protein ACPKPY_05200 [Nitrososphaeraceae archaeon]
MRCYDTIIDKNIIQVLWHHHVLSSSKLKSIIQRKNYCNRIISPDTFSSHLNNLINNGKIIRKEEFPRKGLEYVFYSLSDKTKIEYVLEIINFDNINKKAAIKNLNPELRIYYFIFRVGVSGGICYELKSDTALMKFFEQFRISMDSFKIQDESLRTSMSSIEFSNDIQYWVQDIMCNAYEKITPPYRIFVTDYLSNINGLRLWKERYEYYDYDEPTPRNELFKKLKAVYIPKDFKLSISLWRYFLEGFSISDLIEKSTQYPNISEENIKEVLKKLKNIGIIRRLNTRWKETRYVISDTKLKEALYDYLYLFNMIEEYQVDTWLYVKKPSLKDTELLFFFYGENKTKEIFLKYYNFRKSWKQKNKNSIKTIQKELKEKKKKCISFYNEIKTSHKNTIEKYIFPFEYMIPKLYPSFFDEKTV